jgi:hypothetical protein
VSAAAYNTYKGKVDRGTMTLAQIDQAERGKLLTAAEAAQLRTYWHSVYDVVGLAVEVAPGRGQNLTWTSPLGVHNLAIERRMNGQALPSFLTPAGPGSYVLPPPDETGEVALEVTATVSNAVNGYLGGSASTSATIPAAPAPAPDPATSPTTPPATSASGEVSGDASSPAPTPSSEQSPASAEGSSDPQSGGSSS